MQQRYAAFAAAVRDGQLPSNVVLGKGDGKLQEIVQNKGRAFEHFSTKAPSCQVLHRGPCHGYVKDDDGSFSVGAPGTEEDGALMEFTLDGKERLAAKYRKALFHHPSALCFFPDEGSPEGWLVGFVLVHMDGPDMQAFVGFVCFFGVALPLICLITALLHFNKYERCRQHVSQLRLDYQREQLSQELATRSRITVGGSTRVGSAASSSSAPPTRPVVRSPSERMRGPRGNSARAVAARANAAAGNGVLAISMI